jgi:hypothetical protein
VAAQQLSKLAAQVKMLLREHREPEKKTFKWTSPFTQGVVSFSGTISELAAIAQGTDVSSRVGDAVWIESIDWRQVWYGNLLQTVPNSCRTIIFMDTMNTGTPPVVADVLDSADVGTAAAPFANFNIPNQNTKRFHIIFDQAWSVGVSGNDAFAGNIALHPRMHQRIDFSGSGSTTGLRNRLYVLVISDVNTNDMLFTARCNVHFTDE